MADANAETAGNAPQKKKGGLVFMLMLMLVAVVFGAAGYAVPLIFPQILQGAKTDEVATEPLSPPEPSFVNFGEVVVNLNSDRFNRYLRVNLTMQIDQVQSKAFHAALEGHKAILKNWLLSYLSDQAMEKIRGTAGQNRLRREIQNHFNSVLFPDGYDLIDDVLFEEFNVQ